MSNTHSPISRRDRRRAKDRALVLHAAAEMFAEYGYNETGMTQIAEAADLSVGKLYTLFESKEGRFVNLVEESMRSFTEVGAAAIDPSASPLDQLRQRLNAVLAFFDDHPAFSCIFRKEYPATADGIIAREMQRHVAQATLYLKRAIDAGDIAQEDPEVLATMITACVGSLVEVCENRGIAGSRHWIMDRIERFFLRPLEARRDIEEKHDGATAAQAS